MGDTEKNPRVTFNERTSIWLDEQYPAAMTDPEKVRMAVNDAMSLHKLNQRLMDATAELLVERGEVPIQSEDLEAVADE